MTDAAQPYTLPARDEALEALLGQDLLALSEDSAVFVGAQVLAHVEAVEGEYLQLKADGQRLLCPVADARDLQGQTPEVGAQVDVLVEELRHDGAFRVSIDKPRQLQQLARLQEIAKLPDTIEGEVTLARRQGFSVDCDGVRAFANFEDMGVRRDEAEALVGKRLTFHIRGVDEDNALLLLTRSAFVDAERAESFAAAVSKLEVGQKVEATISRVANFGAFARLDALDGVEGLIHISEIALERVDAKRLPIAVGDVVAVEVVGIDTERQRIALSRRSLLAEALRAKIEALTLNSIVDGEVSGVTDFGAFIELGDGVRGLCHVSELSWTERDKKPAELVAVGDKVQARVIQLDPEGGRVSLSIRQASDNPWSRFLEANPEGTPVQGTIQEIKERGLVIALSDGLEGFVRLSDLSWTIRANAPSDVREFEVGETLTLILLQADSQRQRILLGLKQNEPDPWDLAGDKTQPGTIYEAEVTRLVDNAAFVELVPGLEGRLHISEISVERVESLRAALRIGQRVEVMTKAADRERRRLDVSIKAIEEKRIAEQPRSYADDDTMGGLADALRESGVIKES